jgi:hypothetical protein
MTSLAHHVDDYLAIRRSLGFKLTSEHRLLCEFAAFTDAAGASTVTIELAAAVGNDADRGRPRLSGAADARGARLCALSARHRPGDRDPAGR